MNDTSNANINKKFLDPLCLNNMYIIELLDSFGFQDFSNIKITNNVNGYNIGWTLGFLINELNRDDFLPYEEPSRMLKFKYFLPLITISSIILALILAIKIVLIIKYYRYKPIERTTV